MKKVILIALTVLTFSGVSFAQFEQGRILAGGSIGLTTHSYKSKNNSTTTTSGKGFNMNFEPRVGYFIINNLAAGLGIDSYVSTSKDENSTYKSTRTGLSVSPFVRYYLKQGIFFQGEVGVGSSKIKTTNNNLTTTSKSSTFDWSLGAGYAYFLNKKVAIEPFVGYGANTSKPKGSDNKFIDSGLFINIGFQIYLDTKK